jgi:hypothetical protein
VQDDNEVRVDERSGAFVYSYDFFTPAGRGGVQPGLRLVYNSASRDREAGYGWGLDLPKIEVAPLSGFPEFNADGSLRDERYAFNGQPLVEICAVGDAANECASAMHPAWSVGWKYYRLQVEGPFTRFYRHMDTRTWRAQLKGGRILEFGAPRSDDLSCAPADWRSHLIQIS